MQQTDDPNKPANNKAAIVKTVPDAMDTMLQAHFARQAIRQEKPPAFDTLWAKAQREAAETTPTNIPLAANNWYVPAAVALVIIACSALLMPEFLNRQDTYTPPQETATNHLFNELASTTQWQAPSDPLLASLPHLQVWGMPDVEWQNNSSVELDL